jgi:Icc-related predicted phosphoesterase
MDSEEYQALERDPGRVDALFERLIVDRLVHWIKYAAEKLDGKGVRILTAPANDDPYYIDQTIAEHGGEVFVNVEDRVVELAPGHEMISTGYTNRTPWHTPREHDEDVIAAHIEQMAARLKRPEKAVFNHHPPPYDTKLDLAPKLDQHLSVVTSAGATVMDHVGSHAVADALHRHQPLLSLHGHIHESAGQVRIGATTAINPGSEYGEGVLRGALVRIGGGRIHSYQATSG